MRQMSQILRISLVPPRCWILRRRIHHGPPAIALACAGLRHRGLPGYGLAALGVLLAASDWHDHGVWVRDFVKHPDAYPRKV